MKKVLLVWPPSPYLLEAKIMPPLGVLFIGNYLKQHGHEVKVADLTGVADWKPIIDALVQNFSPDIIGFSSVTPQYPHCLRIRTHLRSQGIAAKMVVGGIHVTSDPSGVERDNWDSMVIGEGENAMLRICQDNPPARHYAEPLIKDLDSIGHPDRDLIDIREYKYDIAGVATTTSFSQRGCIFRCAFCESPLAGGFTVRYHSPQWIGEEADIVKGYGFGGIHFFDDEWNIDLARLHKACDILKTKHMVFRCFFVASRSSPEVLRHMKEAGFYEVLVGFESGSPEILRNIHKPQTVDIMRKFAREVREAGIRWKAASIVGLPGETWDTIRQTEKLLEECNPDDLDVSILQIYPGSPISLAADHYRSLGLHWDIDYKNLESLWYKSDPAKYQELIRVETTGMTKADLIAARMYLENRFKPVEWREKFIKKVPWERLDADLPYVREWARRLQQ